LGFNRVYLQVIEVKGTDPKLNMWMGLVIELRK